MIQKHMISNILIVLLLACFLSPVSAEAENDSYIEELKNEPNFIASKGTIPETIDQEWNNSIRNCWLNVKGPSYYRFDKSIRSIGFRDGVSVVEVSPAYEGQMNKSRIDEIYQKIEFYCEETKGISDIPVVFIWAEEEDYVSLEYDPDAFENIKEDHDFIAARGSVPTFANEDEWMEWSVIVFEARHIDELSNYISNGPLVSYGFNRYKGYIEVGVDKDTSEKVNDHFIDEIYQIIADHYEKEGIHDVPVVFMWSEPFIEETPGFTPLILFMSLLILVMMKKR